MQDHVWQSFEDLLPYDSFSVRIGVRDIPHIVDILRAYSTEDVDRMRLALAQYWGAFIWPPEQGGLAYNFTIESLRKR